MRRYRYATCDVFTHRLFGGNPLAVVLQADGIADAEMQSIAREFNFSETTFVLPPAEPRHAARVRIFTPGAELPFAGHPTVGTAFVLAKLGLVAPRAEAIVLEEGVGPVPVRIARDGSGIAGCTFSVPKLPEQGPAAPPSSELAAMLGLSPSEVADGAECWSCGVPFLVVPLASVEALARCRLDSARCDRLLEGYPTRKVYPAAPAGESAWRVRMFAPSVGVAEDPATGSAAAAFAGWLNARSAAAPPTLTFELRQGQEIGRPSRLALEIDRAGSGNRIAAVRVGGEAVMFSEGTLTL